MVYSQSVVPSPTAFVATTATFYGVGVCLFLLRIYTRVARKQLALDDLFLLVSFVSATGLFVTGVLCSVFGLGSHEWTVSKKQLDHLQHTELANFFCYSWTVTFVKLTLAWQLMRIKGRETGWAITLWTMIGCVVSVWIACNVILFLEVAHKFSFNIIWGYFYTSFNMFTDVVFTVIPLFFIVKVQVTLRDRIILGVLFALGILCSCASIPRLFATTPEMLKDLTYYLSPTMFWSIVEGLIGVIAATCPALRSFLNDSVAKVRSLTGHIPNSSRTSGKTGASYSQARRSMPPPQTDADASLDQETGNWPFTKVSTGSKPGSFSIDEESQHAEYPATNYATREKATSSHYPSSRTHEAV